jgi:CRISPR-associated protein Csm4
MKCKAVFLKPRSSYKSTLHSDLLWGAICWAIQNLYGDQKLEQFLYSYRAESWEDVFFISSALPCFIAKKEASPDKKHICFLPKPNAFIEDKSVLEGSLAEVKEKLRKHKKSRGAAWLNKEAFEYKYGGLATEPADLAFFPDVEIRPMTHNTIDRIDGGTLELNKRGQLYHTEEHFVVSKNTSAEQNETSWPYDTGLFFLLKYEKEEVLQVLETVFRFLEDHGIGGDRSVGKGAFEISLEDFEFIEAEDANALMTLSYYHPKLDGSIYQAIEKGEGAIRYKLKSRQGWKTRQIKGEMKAPMLYFDEHAIFPIPTGHTPNAVYGKNQIVGTHENGHDIYQYGYAFMIKVKV